MSRDRRGNGVQVVAGSNPACPTNSNPLPINKFSASFSSRAATVPSLTWRRSKGTIRSTTSPARAASRAVITCGARSFALTASLLRSCAGKPVFETRLRQPVATLITGRRTWLDAQRECGIVSIGGERAKAR